MAKKKDAKKVVLGLMDKLGIEYTDNIQASRAKSKLKRWLTSGENEMPEDMDLDEHEIDLLSSMGFEVELEGDEGEEETEEVGEDEEVGDAEEEEIEEEEVKPKRRKGKKKAAKKEKTKHVNRWDSVISVLKKRKTHTLEKLVDESSEIYTNAGGKENKKESEAVAVRICQILGEFEVLSFNSDTGKIKMA